MQCQICGGPMHFVFVRHGYEIHECAACRHRSARIDAASAEHTRRIYADDYFSGGAAGYPDYLAEADILVDHGRRYARIVRGATGASPGRMLDVGAAAGFILKGFLESGWQGEGIEPNPRMAAHAREHLSLDVRAGTLEDYAPAGSATESKFDLVNMIQVVAHFVDVRQAMSAAGEQTKSGGFLLIETWNKNSLTARAFGRRWHEYSPPSVVHWFTPTTLARLVNDFGFMEIARGRPSKWLTAAHAQSLLDHKAGESTFNFMLARAASIVPSRLKLPYPAEDLFWALYRKT